MLEKNLAENSKNKAENSENKADNSENKADNSENKRKYEQNTKDRIITEDLSCPQEKVEKMKKKTLEGCCLSAQP